MMESKNYFFSRVLKVFLGVTLLSLLFAGCSKEQKKTDLIFQKETPKNFVKPGEKTPDVKKAVAHLPGKAQIPGAPVGGFSTQTGTAVTPPKTVTPESPTQAEPVASQPVAPTPAKAPPPQQQ